MTRVNIWTWTIVGLLAWGNRAAADEIQLNRNWVGKFNVSVGIIGGPSLGASIVVPSQLESVLDDVPDTFALETLDYADGGQTFDRSMSAFNEITINPTDFPDKPVNLLFDETITLERVEWLNAPSYANVDPAPLGFQGGDTWGANPEAAALEPILLRFVGQYQGFETSSSGPVTEAFDETLEIDPGQLPEFFFTPGSNYPDTLFFGGRPSGGPVQTLDLSFVVGHATRTLRLTGGFVQVPEPGAIALSLIASGGLGLCRAWRRRPKAAA
ncbi:MAG: hypothetical protein SGJ19_13040 [Planctomycetia bacterium]|nr:hypothetical protein [Planctomycetia bacterium]